MTKARSLIIVPMLIASTAGAADLRAGTMDCEPQRPNGARTYWSYRIIDGRTCWYAGRPGKSKSELRWVPAVPRADRLEAHSLSDTCCWPPLEPEPSPAEPTFIKRWNDMQSDLAMPFTRWRQPLKDQQRFGE